MDRAGGTRPQGHGSPCFRFEAGQAGTVTVIEDAMTNATVQPKHDSPSRAQSAAAVQEIFDYLEDFFIFCDAFAVQLTPLQQLVYQRYRETTKSFRHDMAIATRGAPSAADLAGNLR